MYSNALRIKSNCIFHTNWYYDNQVFYVIIRDVALSVNKTCIYYKKIQLNISKLHFHALTIFFFHYYITSHIIFVYKLWIRNWHLALIIKLCMKLLLVMRHYIERKIECIAVSHIWRYAIKVHNIHTSPI